ncbi:hypothetical protein AGRA3207_002143 [Actinomadura graeca]|uniref:Guanylate cyclase domain-containing protein n=1 Tax=Actinomadura graeca TaxID=2750812 RepID=A0ABX8QSZ1_9ACTN|nr:hypothetical protein [Actinomadura graeca]QXJ21304.1 hypothetical protein AGRA3207_002143 [Actinomadura graeca]
MTYQIIDTDHVDTRLTETPSQIWVISSLEITVRQGGRTYLLLTFPSYPLKTGNDSPLHDEGYWTPPFVAYPVPMSFSPPTTVGSLQRSAAERCDSVNLAGDLSHLAYQMGLRDTELEYRGSFIELKRSPRSPELVKAYKIVRYGLVGVDAACQRNLADPDMRRGYVYLPLDGYEEMTRPVHSAFHGRTERWFLGKPLISDVEHIVSDKGARSTMTASAIEIDPAMFSRRESGILCVVDLAGYGAALKYARENMHSFSETTNVIQETFRKSIASQFDQMLARLGTMQVQTAGDGFLATFPRRSFDAACDVVDELLAEWRTVVQRVGLLNEAIKNPAYRVGSRMALHFGEYEYGRIGGVGSSAPAFDGAAIIEVSRLEQALAIAAREGTVPEGSPTGRALVSRDHNVIISTGMRQELGDGWRPRDVAYRHLGEIDLSAKEFAGHGEVWAAGT